MTSIEQVWNYRFPGIDVPIAKFNQRLSEMARAHGWQIETWEEDGLGEVSGVVLKFPSGRTIALLEFRHLIEHFRERGPTASIDESELIKSGINAVLNEILPVLGMSREDVDWVNSSATWVRAETTVSLPPPPDLGPAASYLYGVWLIATDDEPLEWYDELDAERYSLRCVRRYRDGRFEAFSYASENWHDVMPDAPMPPTAEIENDPEFTAKEISQAEFEAVWNEANRSSIGTRRLP